MKSQFFSLVYYPTVLACRPFKYVIRFVVSSLSSRVSLFIY